MIWRNMLSLFAPCVLIASRIESEAVVHPALDHMDATGIEIQHVVFKLHRPIVPQGIFGAEPEHPSADRIAGRKRHTTHRAHINETAAAGMRPGGAQLAVDEPPIECDARSPG